MENQRRQQGFHKNEYFGFHFPENIIKGQYRNISFYENLVVIFGFL